MAAAVPSTAYAVSVGKEGSATTREEPCATGPSPDACTVGDWLPAVPAFSWAAWNSSEGISFGLTVGFSIVSIGMASIMKARRG